MTSFGFSLSGGVDLDTNAYPDLVVGAAHSNQAVLLRSVVDLDTNSYSGSLVDLDTNSYSGQWWIWIQTPTQVSGGS
jgi:hypothetical protein